MCPLLLSQVHHIHHTLLCQILAQLILLPLLLLRSNQLLLLLQENQLLIQTSHHMIHTISHLSLPSHSHLGHMALNLLLRLNRIILEKCLLQPHIQSKVTNKAKNRLLFLNTSCTHLRIQIRLMITLCIEKEGLNLIQCIKLWRSLVSQRC